MNYHRVVLYFIYLSSILLSTGECHGGGQGTANASKQNNSGGSGAAQNGNSQSGSSSSGTRGALNSSGSSGSSGRPPTTNQTAAGATKTGTASPVSPGSATLSANLSSSSQSQGGASNNKESESVKENKLDLNDLKESDDDKGLYKVYSIDDWKVKFFRGYVGQSFNKLTAGTHNLWPENVTKESIYEFLLFEKGDVYLLKMTSIKSEAYLNSTLVYYNTNSGGTNPQREEKSMADFVEKFQQLLGSVFQAPYPNKLPKDVLYQTYQLKLARGSDPSAGKDLDIF